MLHALLEDISMVPCVMFFLLVQRIRFKLIPNIVAGPFIVRKAVGSKPTLLGRKLRQRYFRGPGYVETDVGEP